MDAWYLILGLVGVMGLSSGCGYWKRRKEDKARDGKQGVSQVARVYLNGMQIGSLPVAQHQAMLAKVRGNRRLHLRQAANTLWVSLNLLTRLFPYMLGVWLFGIVLGSLASPAEVGSAVQQTLIALQQAEPGELGTLLKQLLEISMLLALFMVMVEYFMGQGRSYGYRDVFADEMADQLKRELEMPAQGEVEVLYWAIDNRAEVPALDANA